MNITGDKESMKRVNLLKTHAILNIYSKQIFKIHTAKPKPKEEIDKPLIIVVDLNILLSVINGTSRKSANIEQLNNSFNWSTWHF